LVAALALSACGGSGSSTTGQASGQKEVHVGLFMASVADGYTRALSQAVGQHAKEMSATSQTFTATLDPQKQLQQCQDAIVTKKFQAFIIQPVDGPSMVSCARQAIAAGLVDEIDLQINPVILGSGERLFDGFEAGKPALELVRVLGAPGVAHLRYRVVR